MSSQPQINTDEHRFLTGEILRCAMKVSNTLGAGFLEKVYENSLAIELRSKHLTVLQQHKGRFVMKGSSLENIRQISS